MMWVCMYNVWLYDIICIWVWLYIWLYGCMSTWIYVLYMCCIIWDCKFGYMYVYGYTGYVCTVCVIWSDDIRLIYICVIWSCVICAYFVRDTWLEFFVCSFEYYVWLYLILCYVDIDIMNNSNSYCF